MRTPGSTILRAVAEAEGDELSAERWLRRYGPVRPESALRLVCFPHGGSSAVFFRAWSLAAPPAVDVLAVQYPGRMDRSDEPFVDRMEPMADAIAAVLGPRLAPGRFAFFGHSVGAAIAFETALRLRREHGLEPVRLFVSGRRSPRRHRRTERHLAPDDELFAYLGMLGGVDALLERPDLQALVLPLLRSDFKLSETYSPDPDERVDWPLTALVGADDAEVDVDDVADWEYVTGGEFELLVFPGGHFYLRDSEEVLRAVLGRLPILGEWARR